MTWSDDAVRLREFIYRHWCDHGRGPSLGDVWRALGLGRRDALLAYRELQAGNMVVVDDRLQNVPLLKAPPFAGFATDVQCWIDGRFHSFLGCAHEALTVSAMPPLADRVVTIKSVCACCFSDVKIVCHGNDLISVEPAGLLIHVSGTPWDWSGARFDTVCDGISFVLDAGHAERLERQLSRRGMLGAVEPWWVFTQFVRDQRMHDRDWPPLHHRPDVLLEGYRKMGFDVSVWLPDDDR
jgi:hypothetical protein